MTSSSLNNFFLQNPTPHYLSGASGWSPVPNPQQNTYNVNKPKVQPRPTTPDPRTSHNEELRNTIANDPRFAQIISNTPGGIDSIMSGYERGDMSGVFNAAGQPVDTAQANAALKQSMADIDPAYTQEKFKETMDVKDVLAQKQQNYQDQLRKDQGDFETQKAQQDQTAADQGVLFSGGRVQKLNNLKNTFDANQESARNTAARSIGETSRDYQYKYGQDAANDLSSLYKLGSNRYNQNLATGGVSSNRLSNVYSPYTNPDPTGMGLANMGTNYAKQTNEAKQRASGMMWNSSNKLMQNGYNNQFKR